MLVWFVQQLSCHRVTNLVPSSQFNKSGALYDSLTNLVPSMPVCHVWCPLWYNMLYLVPSMPVGHVWCPLRRYVMSGALYNSMLCLVPSTPVCHVWCPLWQCYVKRACRPVVKSDVPYKGHTNKRVSLQSSPPFVVFDFRPFRALFTSCFSWSRDPPTSGQFDDVARLRSVMAPLTFGTIQSYLSLEPISDFKQGRSPWY